MSPTIWPSATSNETRSSATMPPKRTVRSRTDRMGWSDTDICSRLYGERRALSTPGTPGTAVGLPLMIRRRLVTLGRARPEHYSEPEEPPMNKMLMCLLPVGNLDMPGYQPTIALAARVIVQRRRQVTAVIRAVSLVIGLLAVSGVAGAQTRLDVLAAFGPAGLQSPQAPLIQGIDGNFYGTTARGGASNAGTVFQLTPAGALTVLYAFTGGTDGATPFAGLIQATDGNFYGTTVSGGASSAGTVFQLTPAGAVSVLYAFTGETDGAAPIAGVIQAADGNFFGVTQSGGALGGGTAFRLRSAIPTTITWNPPAPIEYGTALSATQLDATASVPGTFAYMPPAGTVLQAGPQTLAVTFTPTDTNYAIATSTVTLTVTAAAPVITWNPPASIAYGRALSGRELNATANTPGTFAYSPPAGTVFGVGTQTLSVTFTPTDGPDYTTVTSSVTLTVTPVATTTTSGGGNEYPLQFTPSAGYRGLVVAGYQLVANSFGGLTVVGNCSYYTVRSGSGRGGGYRTITTHYDQTCTWDLYGNLLTVIPGAPVVPTPLSVNGTQTIYAANAQGVFTGSDSALPFHGFVYTPGSHFSWLTPNPYTVLSQTVYTVTATLKSDGDMPLSISSVRASTLRGIVTVSSNTCTGQIPVGSTCAVSVTYDPTRLRSATGLAYDTLDISVISDAGQVRDFVQSYTIVLNTPSDD